MKNVSVFILFISLSLFAGNMSGRGLVLNEEQKDQLNDHLEGIRSILNDGQSIEDFQRQPRTAPAESKIDIMRMDDEHLFSILYNLWGIDIFQGQMSNQHFNRAKEKCIRKILKIKLGTNYRTSTYSELEKTIIRFAVNHKMAKKIYTQYKQEYFRELIPFEQPPR
jgi:hypothetical protein